MANERISQMPAISSFATGDLLPIVDVSEISASDKNKSVTFGELFRNVLGGSASAPSIAFTGDQNTGIYSPGADQVAVATNGTGRLFVDASGSISTSSTAWQGGSAYQLGGLQIGASTYAKALLQTGGTSRAEWLFDSADNYLLAKSGSFYIFNTTANPITFATNGSERLRISSTGLVGIGTSSPQASARLHVYATGDYIDESAPFTVGDSTAGGMRLFFGINNTSNYGYIGSVESATAYRSLVLQPGGGNVGIGTTSPNSKLAVSNGGAESFEFYPADASNVNKINYYNRSGAVYCDAVQNAASHQFAIQGTEKARLDSSGRLLVGTSTSTSATVNGLVGKTQIASSENAALALHGHSSTALYGADIVFTRSRSATIGTNTIVQNGDEFGRIYFTGANGTGFDYGASIQAVVDGTPGVGDMPGRLVFSTTADGASTPTERMRITNAGKVLIGTSTSANTVVFAVQSDVAGSAGGNYPLATIESTGTSDSGAACLHLGKKANDTSTSNVFQRFYINSSGTGSGQINANGASAAAFGSFSDERLKENIVDLPPQLQNICDLRPVEFDYKDGSGHQIGFIAQEMQEVYPDVIGETEGTLTVTGWSKTEARLVKALQEAIGRIEALEGMVAVNNITIDEQQHQLSTLAARLTALESA
jgi:uncharacterized coiled-coil protein SlyX